jgi:hypothetical protein
MGECEGEKGSREGDKIACLALGTQPQQ